MRLVYRPIEHWPGMLTEWRKASPFKAAWADTLQLLNQELEQLDVVDDVAILQVALTENDLRIDGSIKVRANLAHPGVILSFESKRHGKLSYPCDTFESPTWRSVPSWQANVRAIALGLEALRKVERYGIAPHGEQYTGWKALGAGTPLGPARMTVDQAAGFIVLYADLPLLGVDDTPWQTLVLEDPDAAAQAYRQAAKRLHPDTGGDLELFKTLQDAWRLVRR